MTNIYLCGEKKEDSISNVMKRVGKKYKGFYIYNIQNLRDIRSDCDVLVFKTSFSYQKHKLKNSFLSVVESQNHSAISFLSENNLAAITCGMCFKDTLIISSLSSQKATISLQRSIITKDNKILEPRDITIVLEQKTGVYPILVSAVALLIAFPNAKNEYKF